VVRPPGFEPGIAGLEVLCSQPCQIEPLLGSDPLLAGVAMSFSTLAPLTLGRCYVARVHRFADRG